MKQIDAKHLTVSKSSTMVDIAGKVNIKKYFTPPPFTTVHSTYAQFALLVYFVCKI